MTTLPVRDPGHPPMAVDSVAVSRWAAQAVRNTVPDPSPRVVVVAPHRLAGVQHWSGRPTAAGPASNTAAGISG
ncbi:hypothetical protein [Streptomyces sp. NBC_00055]|uniref:hypothetical protein n=1 Tax=Streptomyces sp. NBC_00055 TaxID=2975632 RepID=UPI003254A68F